MVTCHCFFCGVKLFIHMLLFIWLTSSLRAMPVFNSFLYSQCPVWCPSQKQAASPVQGAQWVALSCHTPNGCGFDPQSGGIWEAIDWCFSLSLFFFFFFVSPPSLPPSPSSSTLSRINKHVLGWGFNKATSKRLMHSICMTECYAGWPADCWPRSGSASGLPNRNSWGLRNQQPDFPVQTSQCKFGQNEPLSLGFKIKEKFKFEHWETKP